MSSGKCKLLRLELIALVEEINRYARLIGAPEVFDRSSVSIAGGMGSELGFIRIVSWLYIHYQEVGRIGVGFLMRQLSGAEMDSGAAIIDHVRTVRELRTYLQHNIDLTSERSKEIEQRCGIWFHASCGTSLPSKVGDWAKCEAKILQEATYFLNACKVWLRTLDGSEQKQDVVTGWKNEVDRYHPPHQFDALAEKVKNDFGHPSFDHLALRKRNYERWIAALRTRELPYDFEQVARPLVEKAVLQDAGGAPPVDGKDIMEKFGLPPGPLIKKIIAQIGRMYDDRPRTREALLKDLEADPEILGLISESQNLPQ